MSKPHSSAVPAKLYDILVSIKDKNMSMIYIFLGPKMLLRFNGSRSSGKIKTDVRVNADTTSKLFS
eukprot:CAMPEP_0194154140 /NCGR_PEP_ID=MMETSP0152-20130528/59378_1 /TAXON_ID=1049557 /ORGANISM="Thalassiothrix antarctica, Strain L6-D1" /LENGTH=65 /DNA_ID=CAMNT_0038859987 /DNA_START=44 /DNA_END=238 /DNA_ORIENTATION=+